MEKFPQNNQEQIKYPDISRDLVAMRLKDQEIRKTAMEEGFELSPELNTKWKEIDEENTKKMKHIISQIGWPTVSKVGKEPSHNAWLLVQHADHDLDFQKECLALMQEAPKGEVDLGDVAYLEDRIRVNTNQKQIYGTQFQETMGGVNNKEVLAYRPKPIEDEDHVNERRALIGLEALEEYTEELTRQRYPHLLEKK
jgi:hypothetical protein